MIREVVEQALDLEPGDRTAFLDEACAGDPDLRREAESLLTLHAAPVSLPPAPPARIPVGSVVDGKYRIDRLLGTGGMGAVYRATHLQLERAVALKGIRTELLASPSAAERFRREAVAVARLRHPHIVTVHDYGVTADAGAYLVMELLEGHSLRDELAASARLDVPTALAIAAQVCAAVAAAHRAGVVHRDLKPENIFLERRDAGLAVKVVDFGLAKLEAAVRSRDAAITHEGAVLGTPVYMSPEQCRGEEADTRSDVYMLGCVFYEMLTGERPFGGKNVWALVYQHVNETPRRPSEIVPTLDPRIDGALMRALAKDPADRFQTAEAFADALGAPSVSGASFPSFGTPAAPAASAPPTNLPHAVTSFVGREREVGEVREWLSRARLVTLVGPGGIGKTRLALETAAGVVGEYADGVWLVELASLADPALVPRAVGAALGVQDHGGRSDVEAVEAFLRDKRALVVMDNCEHLVGACAALIGRLLVASAGLRVLATSRESLGIAGEAVWPVPALAVPEPNAGDVRECEAVRLFADRASLANPGFEMTDAVVELCRRLEGIPLAIELAAARVKALSVEQILERLGDRFRLLGGASRTAPTRQQTLRATLDWSYELLTDEERALLRQLSVFAGGWTLEAAEEVASGQEDVAREEPSQTTDHGPRTTDHGQLTTLDLLSRLVDKSLVMVHERQGTARYGMLETIREYASGLLSQSGEGDAVRRRHAEYFVVESEASRRAISDGVSAEWLEKMEAEHDNVRAALAWSLENDPDSCVRLAAAAHPFREMRGHLTESRRSLEAALARETTASALVLAEAYLALGRVASLQGDVAVARGFYARGLPLAKEAGNTKQVAVATYIMGTLANMEGDLGAARALLEESLAISREAGYVNVVIPCLNSLGEAARLEGDAGAARAYYEQAVAVARGKRQDHFLIIPLCNLGAVACEGGDVDVARACYEEALMTARVLGSTEFVSLSLDGLAAVAAKRGAWERAGRLAGAAAALLEEIGATLAPVDLAFRERYLGEVREHVGEAALEAALAEGRAMVRDEAIEDAMSA